MELGVQPLDGFMREHELSNHDVVAASPVQLTHKVVNKGRKGRRLTVRAQKKILDALTRALGDDVEAPKLDELFNYRGR